jgi:hypothetical protein
MLLEFIYRDSDYLMLLRYHLTSEYYVDSYPLQQPPGSGVWMGGPHLGASRLH